MTPLCLYLLPYNAPAQKRTRLLEVSKSRQYSSLRWLLAAADNHRRIIGSSFSDVHTARAVHASTKRQDTHWLLCTGTAAAFASVEFKTRKLCGGPIQPLQGSREGYAVALRWRRCSGLERRSRRRSSGWRRLRACFWPGLRRRKIKGRMRTRLRRLQALQAQVVSFGRKLLLQ